ncbi:MAG: hypothetical protein Q9208_007115 [Pyrenodesmia sp. 3 TL-2023]
MSTDLPPPSDSTDQIQRILFLAPRVHIYTVPPLTSTKGYTTTAWTPFTTPPPSRAPITTRLRIVETSSSSTAPASASTISTTILLEDPTTAQLFAACPYTSPACVEPTLDSARFFALRVESEGGRKAVLGIGFEERGEGCEFVDVLRGVGRMMGWEKDKGASGRAGGGGGGGVNGVKGKGEEKKRDWSLKDGEMIRIQIGGVSRVDGSNREERGEDGRTHSEGEGQGEGEAEGALFSIKPPPAGGGGVPALAPPPSAKEVKAERRRSRGMVELEKESAAELGFDDGEFGEFQ